MPGSDVHVQQEIQRCNEDEASSDSLCTRKQPLDSPESPELDLLSLFELHSLLLHCLALSFLS